MKVNVGDEIGQGTWRVTKATHNEISLMNISGKSLNNVHFGDGGDHDGYKMYSKFLPGQPLFVCTPSSGLSGSTNKVATPGQFELHWNRRKGPESVVIHY